MAEDESLVATPLSTPSSTLGLASLPHAPLHQLQHASLLPLIASSSSARASVSASSDHVLRGRSSARPPNTRRRTKLSSQERAKILEVRRQRACLRCKMLKIQCSKENPCKPCLSSAVRGYERKVLSFCYCVRTRFTDVDIFHRSEEGPPPDVPASIRALMDRVERPTLPPAAVRINDDSNNQTKHPQSTANSNNTNTSSSPSAAATANPFEDTLLRWLTSPDHAPPDGTGSIVALLYDMVGHADSLRAAVDDRLPADFQTFLFTTSLAHTGWRGSSGPGVLATGGARPVTHRDLCIAGHVCGSRIVRRLDRILTPQFLAKCDRTTHRALLLLVFGVILGVSYSTRLTTSPSFPHDLLGAEMRHSPTLWLAMKEHLAQMLAHHLIFLGSTLGIKLDTAAEKTIIDTAVNRWNKPERSLWAGIAGWAVPPVPQVPQMPADTMQSRSYGVNMGYPGVDLDQQQHQQHLHPQHLHQYLHPHQQAFMSSAPMDGAASPHTLPPAMSPPSSAMMSMMSMVALSDPDLLELQAVPPMSEDDCSANPESFYNMGNGLADGVDASGHLSLVSAGQMPTGLGEFQRGPPSRPGDPGGDSHRRTRKKRSVWIVRPFDGGGNRDPVSVFARFQVQSGQNLGLFV